jgi:hypothetical protein
MAGHCSVSYVKEAVSSTNYSALAFFVASGRQPLNFFFDKERFIT